MWRAMSSLIVLRDQVNAIAPDRGRASDGLVGDAAHQQEVSDHNPHDVDGVGRDIVSALDLTHDPAHGFDSYRFAETLRENRDSRIKYVISDHRIFFSYVHYGTPAWTWGPYGGADPHTNHTHVSVIDNRSAEVNRLSDTRTPWNLEDDMAITDADASKIASTLLGTTLGRGTRTVGQAIQDTDARTAQILTAVTGALPALVQQAIQAASDDPDVAVTLTAGQIAAFGAAVTADVVAQLHVPTVAEVADAVVDEERDRLAE